MLSFDLRFGNSLSILDCNNNRSSSAIKVEYYRMLNYRSIRLTGNKQKEYKKQCTAH